MNKRLAIDLLQKANNPATQSFTDVEIDDDVSVFPVFIYKFFFKRYFLYLFKVKIRN